MTHRWKQAARTPRTGLPRGPSLVVPNGMSGLCPGETTPGEDAMAIRR